MKKYFLYFLILGFFYCQHDNKTVQLSSEQLESGLDVYETFLRFTYMDTLSIRNSNELLDSALVIHNMKKDEFLNVIEYFKKHPDDFNKALTQINEHLNELSETDSK